MNRKPGTFLHRQAERKFRGGRGAKRYSRMRAVGVTVCVADA